MLMLTSVRPMAVGYEWQNQGSVTADDGWTGYYDTTLHDGSDREVLHCSSGPGLMYTHARTQARTHAIHLDRSPMSLA
jgi:hypothetical protein